MYNQEYDYIHDEECLSKHEFRLDIYKDSEKLYLFNIDF